MAQCSLWERYHPGRSKYILRRNTCGSPFGYQIIETTGLKKFEFPPEVSCWGKRKAGTLVPARRRYCLPHHTVLATRQTNLQERLELGEQWWAVMGRTTFDQDCLVMYNSCLLLEPKPHVRTLKDGLGGAGHWNALVVPLPGCGHAGKPPHC